MHTASKHPQLVVRMWGPGWPLWDKTKTPAENVAVAFGSENAFDIIYTKTWHHAESFSNTVVIHAPGDCHSLKCLQASQINPYADGLTMRYAGLIMDLFRWEQWKSRLANNSNDLKNQKKPHLPFIFHSPDCADESILYPAINLTSVDDNENYNNMNGNKLIWKLWESSRTQEILLIGHISDMYPLRKTVAAGIKAGIITGSIYSHPGYQHKSSTSRLSFNQSELGIYNAHDPDVSHLVSNNFIFISSQSLT